MDVVTSGSETPQVVQHEFKYSIGSTHRFNMIGENATEAQDVAASR